MKKYTQEEFDNFERDEDGNKICPTGDYTNIKYFGARCRFSAWCSFGRWCTFGDWSSFGDWCCFDALCHFGARSSFGDWCHFARYCFIGEQCSFGELCNFARYCDFENGRVINGIYFACDRIGSEKRKTYFFKGDNGYFVRAGCFFGTFDEFVDRVHQVHAGTKYEKEYELAIELAKVVLG